MLWHVIDNISHNVISNYLHQNYVGVPVVISGSQENADVMFSFSEVTSWYLYFKQVL